MKADIKSSFSGATSLTDPFLKIELIDYLSMRRLDSAIGIPKDKHDANYHHDQFQFTANPPPFVVKKFMENCYGGFFLGEESVNWSVYRRTQKAE